MDEDGGCLSLLQHGQGSVTRDRPPARVHAPGWGLVGPLQVGNFRVCKGVQL